MAIIRNFSEGVAGTYTKGAAKEQHVMDNTNQSTIKAVSNVVGNLGQIAKRVEDNYNFSSAQETTNKWNKANNNLTSQLAEGRNKNLTLEEMNIDPKSINASSTGSDGPIRISELSSEQYQTLIRNKRAEIKGGKEIGAFTNGYERQAISSFDAQSVLAEKQGHIDFINMKEGIVHNRNMVKLNAATDIIISKGLDLTANYSGLHRSAQESAATSIQDPKKTFDTLSSDMSKSARNIIDTMDFDTVQKFIADYKKMGKPVTIGDKEIPFYKLFDSTVMQKAKMVERREERTNGGKKQARDAKADTQLKDIESMIVGGAGAKSNLQIDLSEEFDKNNNVAYDDLNQKMKDKDGKTVYKHRKNELVYPTAKTLRDLNDDLENGTTTYPEVMNKTQELYDGLMNTEGATPDQKERARDFLHSYAKGLKTRLKKENDTQNKLYPQFNSYEQSKKSREGRGLTYNIIDADEKAKIKLLPPNEQRNALQNVVKRAKIQTLHGKREAYRQLRNEIGPEAAISLTVGEVNDNVLNEEHDLVASVTPEEFNNRLPTTDDKAKFKEVNENVHRNLEGYNNDPRLSSMIEVKLKARVLNNTNSFKNSNVSDIADEVSNEVKKMYDEKFISYPVGDGKEFILKSSIPDKQRSDIEAIPDYTNIFIQNMRNKKGLNSNERKLLELYGSGEVVARLDGVGEVGFFYVGDSGTADRPFRGYGFKMEDMRGKLRDYHKSNEIPKILMPTEIK